MTLQANCYLADTAAEVRADAEYSTVLDRAIARARQAGLEGDEEAAVSFGRLRAIDYSQLVQRYLYGTPEEIVDRLQEYQQTLGITGVSLNMNVGGQIPYEASLRVSGFFEDYAAPLSVPQATNVGNGEAGASSPTINRGLARVDETGIHKSPMKGQDFMGFRARVITPIAE